MLPFKGIEYAESLSAIHAKCFEKPWSLKNFQEILNLPNTFGFCTQEGFILCADLGEDIEILTFAVLPEYHRKGIGTSLLTALQNFAIQQKKKHIFLEVKATNIAAKSLYLKNEFIQTGLRKNYYHEQGKSFDALCLTWQNPQLKARDSV